MAEIALKRESAQTGGASPSFDELLQMYTRAANQGYVEAQMGVARMQAKRWMRVAMRRKPCGPWYMA